MGQRRIYEIEFSSFSSSLRKAKINHQCIEKTNKEAWVNYVKTYNVPEAAMASRGKGASMSGKFDVIIIEGAGSADGYFVYSTAEGFCLKFEHGMD